MWMVLGIAQEKIVYGGRFMQNGMGCGRAGPMPVYENTLDYYRITFKKRQTVLCLNHQRINVKILELSNSK